VSEITEGSPLFVVEAVRLWRTEGRFDTAGRLQGDGLALFGRIRELFQRCVPRDARALLDAESVLGREFDAMLLERTVDSVPPSDALDTILQADCCARSASCPSGTRSRTGCCGRRCTASWLRPSPRHPITWQL
jgi:hypothetical protein